MRNGLRGAGGAGPAGGQSISQNDHPAVQAIRLTIAWYCVLLTLAGALLNAAFDPRIRPGDGLRDLLAADRRG